MSTSAFDPLIHNPVRLPIVAVLAALPDGDALSITRLQKVVRQAPGRLATCLCELEQAGYVRTGRGTATLTRDGRVALDRYIAVLRQGPARDVRVDDAERDAIAAALGEHFAQGTSHKAG